jgi:hypothetical protein
VLTIQFPDFRERLTGRQVSDGVWELTDFSRFVPLAPGDRVKVTPDQQIVGYTNLSDLIVVEAYFRMDATPEQVKAAAEVWHRSTHVQVSSPLTVLIACGNACWLEHEVEGHELVDWVDLVRVPTETFSWDQKVREA